MRNTIVRMGILAAVTAVLLLATMTAASAGPPCDKNPDHASCITTIPPSTTTTTEPGTTTTTTVPTGETTCAALTPHDLLEATDGFTVDLEPRQTVCVDWTTTVESFWSVTLEPAAAGRVFLKVTDTPYGPLEDRCWNAILDKGATSTTIFHQAVFNGDDGPLPVSDTGACGEAGDTAASYVLVVMPMDGKPNPITVTVTPTATPPG